MGGTGGMVLGPGKCNVKADCKFAALNCDTASHDCVECANDGQCPSPKKCLLNTSTTPAPFGRCVECLGNTDCQSGLCGPVNRCLITGCSNSGGTTTGCPSNGTFKCEDNGITGVAVPICVSCETDMPCPTPQICDGRLGVNACVQCNSDASCATGTHCDITVTFTCVQCRDSRDCTSPTPLCDPASHNCGA